MTLMTPAVGEQTRVALNTGEDDNWSVLVWNDDTNTGPYVVSILQIVLGKPEDECMKLVKQIEADGKAAVFTGPKSKARNIRDQITSAMIWASLEVGK